MESAPRDEFEVGKTVDEWLMIDDTGQELYNGMVGERVDAGGKVTFVEKADGSCEVLLVGPPDADGRRRIGIHRAKS